MKKKRDDKIKNKLESRKKIEKKTTENTNGTKPLHEDFTLTESRRIYDERKTRTRRQKEKQLNVKDKRENQ